MSLTLWAIILVVLFIIVIFTKRVPLPLAMLLLPLAVGLLIGTDLPTILDAYKTQFGNSMTNAGLLMIFSLLYFGTLTETGFFNRISTEIFFLLKGKMNVWMVMIMTYVLMTIGKFTGANAAAWFITFPLMIPFYDKMGFSRTDAMILTCVAHAMTSCLPWTTNVVNQAVIAEVEISEFAHMVVRSMWGYIPVAIAEMFYFAYCHKKNGGKNEVQLSKEELEELRTALKDGKYVRPNMFWFNLVVFIASMVMVVLDKIPAYIVFAVSSCLTYVFNYPNPKDQGFLISKQAPNIFSALFICAGFTMYLAVMNCTGMTGAVAQTISSHIGAKGVRAAELGLLGISVPFCRVLPYQIYNTLKPVMYAVGESVGIPRGQMAVPFVSLMAMGTASSPMTASTLVGTGLLGLDANEYSKRAVPVSFVGSLIYIVVGVIFRLF